jgi:nitroimidazol reductase NimA-like FMN-containing flavoprotein (pyridoxamine 5'-phosphate oxidase superfamily)
MTVDYALRSPSEVRRKDREVADEAWIVEMLRRAPMACVATVDEGQPFVNSNTFVYAENEHAIYMHTSAHGRTRSNIGGDDRVCLTVTEMGRLLPAPRAFSMSVEYASVVAFGRARMVEDAGEKSAALLRLIAKYYPHLSPAADYASPDEKELALTAVYRIDIESWSGKMKQVEPDFPGAFTYPYREERADVR